MPNFPFFLMFSFYNILLVYEMTLWRPKQILPKIHICSRILSTFIKVLLPRVCFGGNERVHTIL